MQRSYISAIAAAAAGGGLLLYLSRQKRKRITLVNYYKTLYYEQQANGALINAHFLFNALGSLQHFIHSHPAGTANAYIADLAALIRMRMENSRELFISIQDEIRNIRAYLGVEQQRLGDQLRYDISIDGNIDAGLLIPGLVLQPFVENAVWHGVMPLPHTGTVSIRFTKPNEATIQVEISDDGVGINTSRNNKKDGTRSLGISLVRERLGLLKQLTRSDYNISICETASDNQVTGTRVVITFPAHPDVSLPEQFRN